MAIHEYVITIRAPGGDGSDNKSTPPVASKDSEAVKASKVQEKSVSKYIAAQTITPMINSAATLVTSNVNTLTGSSELQQRVNFGQQMVSIGTGAVSNITSMAAVTGSMAAGIGVGLILTAISVGISTAQKYAETELAKTVEDEKLKLVRMRMGSAYNGSRS